MLNEEEVEKGSLWINIIHKEGLYVNTVVLFFVVLNVYFLLVLLQEEQTPKMSNRCVFGEKSF